MLGLRKQEDEKFNTFFLIVQAEAQKQDKVFYADAGDGNEFETATMEGENIMGWLIPKEKAQKFEQLWKSSKVDDTWSEFYKWAIWTEEEGNIIIKFE